MKIGIYDSGIGGLSVLHRALKKMPEAEFIYYADTKHVPYGEKTREQIKGYVEEVLNFLIAKEVDAIVIACNTATSVATKNSEANLPYRSSVWNRQSSARSSSIRICRNGSW